MLDFMKSVINIGDVVATNRSGYTDSFVTAEVTGFTAQKVRIRYSEHNDETLKYPQQLIVVRSTLG
jgi:hypothetical protein